ncbi:MAG: threonine/serine dehydratase [Rhodospirillales bacterium]|nr:threonine/serine dehydratase [Rhodospirillales bacterium]
MSDGRDAASDAEAPGPLPQPGDVHAAAARLAGHAVETPLLRADALDERIGGRLLLKAEPLQRTGSFKFRGACNRLLQLDAGAKANGVVTYSSGNHAQAVALAARLVGVPAVIVMPRDAPAVKIAGTRRHGAEVVLYDRNSEAREALGKRIAEERGATLVKPYDDFNVIAGQGTVGREIVRQCDAIGCRPDAVIVPAGGGGLMAGTSLAIADAWPEARLHTAEPQGYDDHAMSFERGQRVGVSGAQGQSFCDALLAPKPGALTFPINVERVHSGVAVSDAEVGAAMRAAFMHLKLVVEPGGAVALAAVLAGKIATAGRTVVAVLSGGNVDLATFRAVLTQGDGPQAT